MKNQYKHSQSYSMVWFVLFLDEVQIWFYSNWSAKTLLEDFSDLEKSLKSLKKCNILKANFRCEFGSSLDILIYKYIKACHK